MLNGKRATRDPVISLRGGGLALRFRIKSGLRHSITVGGFRSSSANFSLIVEKYQFIKAPPPTLYVIKVPPPIALT